MRNGRKRFLEKWKPRRRCGQWRAEKFKRIYELAKQSIGLKDPYRADEFEIKTLAKDLADALKKQQMWLDKAVAFVEDRSDFGLLMSMPKMGKPTAVAILTAVGSINEYTNGKQLVKLAGLDIRLYESGSSILKRPRISRAGSAYLRHWVYYLSMRLVAHEPEFKEYFQRRKEKSPGKGAGIRALTSVSDKVLRIIYRMLKDNEKYLPGKDKRTKEYYIKQRKAA
jgi:transposase